MSRCIRYEAGRRSRESPAMSSGNFGKSRMCSTKRLRSLRHPVVARPAETDDCASPSGMVTRCGSPALAASAIVTNSASASFSVQFDPIGGLRRRAGSYGRASRTTMLAETTKAGIAPGLRSFCRCRASAYSAACCGVSASPRSPARGRHGLGERHADAGAVVGMDLVEMRQLALLDLLGDARPSPRRCWRTAAPSGPASNRLNSARGWL